MAQPIQEPTQDRAVAGLEFRSRQLFRRPANGTMNVVYAIKVTGDNDGVNPVSFAGAYMSFGIPAELNDWYVVKFWGYQETPGALGTDTSIRLGRRVGPSWTYTEVTNTRIVIDDDGYFPSTEAVLDDTGNQVYGENSFLIPEISAVDGAYGIGVEITLSPTNELL